MKKVLYLLYMFVAFTACDKPEEDNSGWKKETINTETEHDLCYLYHNQDSVIVEYNRWNEISEDYNTEVYKLSTHNNVFEGINPLEMTENEVIEFAQRWMEEIKREPDLEVWKKAINCIKYEDKDYGLLWGLTASGVSLFSSSQNENPRIYVIFSYDESESWARGIAGYSYAYSYNNLNSDEDVVIVYKYRKTLRGAEPVEIARFDF
ncbi:MAG: hypothetical protein U0K66_12090 [Paludibacteraceae bacterium]|nr:hypothetical protein [Paludibacteraceae bacterium]